MLPRHILKYVNLNQFYRKHLWAFHWSETYTYDYLVERLISADLKTAISLDHLSLCWSIFSEPIVCSVVSLRLDLITFLHHSSWAIILCYLTFSLAANQRTSFLIPKNPKVPFIFPTMCICVRTLMMIPFEIMHVNAFSIKQMHRLNNIAVKMHCRNLIHIPINRILVNLCDPIRPLNLTFQLCLLHFVSENLVLWRTLVCKRFCEEQVDCSNFSVVGCTSECNILVPL